MLLVSGGFTVLLRISEKQAQFFGVNSTESGLQPFSPQELMHMGLRECLKQEKATSAESGSHLERQGG